MITWAWIPWFKWTEQTFQRISNWQSWVDYNHPWPMSSLSFKFISFHSIRFQCIVSFTTYHDLLVICLVDFINKQTKNKKTYVVYLLNLFHFNLNFIIAYYFLVFSCHKYMWHCHSFFYKTKQKSTTIFDC